MDRGWAILLVGSAAVVASEAARYFLARGARGRYHIEGPYFILVLLCLLAAAAAPDAQDAPIPAATPGRRAAWLLPVLILIALVLYWPALTLGFLSDDFDRSYAAFDALGGPVLVHLVNVVLHAINAWLVARLARALGAGDGAAVSAALLFVVFPASVEPVAWVSGLPDLLMTTAVLAGLLAWGAARWRVAGTVAALVVALAAKETAVAFPLLGFVVWARRGTLRATAAIAGTLTLVVVVYGAWRMTAPLPADSAPAPDGGLVKEMLVRPFGTLGAPYRTDAGRLELALSLAAGVLAPLILAASALAWRRDREAFARAARLALWVLIAVLPVYRYLYVARDLQGSRYLYLPSAGWSILLAGTAETLLSKPPTGRLARTGLLVVVLALHAVALRRHLVPWREAAALRDTILASARPAMATRGCGPDSQFIVPDSVHGAFVFRNGFRQALRRAGTLPGSGRPCRLRWYKGAFADY